MEVGQLSRLRSLALSVDSQALWDNVELCCERFIYAESVPLERAESVSSAAAPSPLLRFRTATRLTLSRATDWAATELSRTRKQLAGASSPTIAPRPWFHFSATPSLLAPLAFLCSPARCILPDEEMMAARLAATDSRNLLSRERRSTRSASWSFVLGEGPVCLETGVRRDAAYSRAASSQARRWEPGLRQR